MASKRQKPTATEVAAVRTSLGLGPQKPTVTTAQGFLGSMRDAPSTSDTGWRKIETGEPGSSFYGPPKPKAKGTAAPKEGVGVDDGYDYAPSRQTKSTAPIQRQRYTIKDPFIGPQLNPNLERPAPKGSPKHTPVYVDPATRRQTAVAMGRPEVPSVEGGYKGYRYPVGEKEHTARAGAIGELMIRQRVGGEWSAMRRHPNANPPETESFVQYETSPRQMREQGMPVGRPQRSVRTFGEGARPQVSTPSRPSVTGPNRITRPGPPQVNPAYNPKFDEIVKKGGPVETRVDPSIMTPEAFDKHTKAAAAAAAQAKKASKGKKTK